MHLGIRWRKLQRESIACPGNPAFIYITFGQDMVNRFMKFKDPGEYIETMYFF